MSEGAIFILGWAVLLIASIFAVWGVLRCWRWWVERRERREWAKAWKDCLLYGTGVTRNGKHIPYREFFKP